MKKVSLFFVLLILVALAPIAQAEFSIRWFQPVKIESVTTIPMEDGSWIEVTVYNDGSVKRQRFYPRNVVVVNSVYFSFQSGGSDHHSDHYQHKGGRGDGGDRRHK